MERNRAGLASITKDITKEVGKNFLMGIPAFRRWRLNRPRAGAAFSGDDSALERYAFLGLNFLRQYVGDVRGRSVLEIGAGDYLTSGLSLLAAGASSYGVIDRFPGNYTGEDAKSWYRGIEKNWSRFYPEISWVQNLKTEDFPEKYEDLLELIREPIETATPRKQYDIVCSFQVGEHISDLDAYAEIHNRAMTKEGVALHRVDFGPHDCWILYRDPLTFLTFPDWLWKMSGSNRGTPNRFRHHEFIAAFERAGLMVETVFLDYWKDDTVDFSRLHQKFRAMPPESLKVGTAIYKLTRKK